MSWRHTIAGSAVSGIYYGLPLKDGIDVDAVEAAADTVYKLASMETRFVRRDARGVPTCWWRGVGPTRSVFVVESFMDELAAAAAAGPGAVPPRAPRSAAHARGARAGRDACRVGHGVACRDTAAACRCSLPSAATSLRWWR